jgi:hypothetical protein
MYTIFQQNIQRIPNNVVIVIPTQLILIEKNTLEIERREKNTYYNKIIK